MNELFRKSLIYKTGVEYGDYTINHVLGCSHGCNYPCYAYQMAKRFGKVKSYDEWIKPTIVANTLELLEKELPKFEGKINVLNLCFSTDPFMMNQDKIIELSMEILKRLNAHDIVCSVLTKGLLPIELEKLSKKNQYGITVVTLDDDFRKKMEPGASQIDERIRSLKVLHEKGCKTWVSIEPYPTPNFITQNLKVILESINFVDKIIFGRMHYNKQVSMYNEYKQFYNQCAGEVISFCDEKSIEYHIKEGTITE